MAASDSDISDPTFKPSQSSSPDPTPQQQLSSQEGDLQAQQHHPGPFTSSPNQVLAYELPFHPSTTSSQSGNSPVRKLHSHLKKPQLRQSSFSPSAQGSTSKSPTLTHLRLPPDLPPYRPNRFYGPPATYRSWTEQERLVVQSLEQVRAQNLSIHLYNAYILKRKAEAANLPSGSRSRSRSRSQSRNRSASRTRKSKGKGKAPATSDDEDDNESPGPPARSYSRKEDIDKEEILFNPPRLWTAWPLPPTEVPRDPFLPPTLSNSAYRSKPDPRPSAELEECLIAITTRYAREKWESREWESDDHDEIENRPRKRKRSSGSISSRKRDPPTREDGIDTASEAQSDPESPAQPSSPSSPPDDIPTFSSQMFTTAVSDSSSSSSSRSSTSSSRHNSPSPTRPTFSADDEAIHALLLPGTRHILSQFDSLLRALHIMQKGRRRRRETDVRGRSADEVLGLAELCFGRAVAERARGRWAGLMEEGSGGE